MGVCVEKSLSIDDSAEGADHAIEVGSSFGNQCRAVALNGFHLAETSFHWVGACGVGLVDVSRGGGLHDGHSTGGGLKGHAQSDVGFLQAVQAAVIQDGSITSQQGVGDVAENDLAVAQASSHAAVGVAVAAGLDQAGVLANHASHSVGDDAGGVGGDCINSVKALVPFGDEAFQGSKCSTADGGGFGVGANDGAGKCVEHERGLVWGG